MGLLGRCSCRLKNQKSVKSEVLQVRKGGVELLHELGVQLFCSKCLEQFWECMSYSCF